MWANQMTRQNQSFTKKPEEKGEINIRQVEFEGKVEGWGGRRVEE